jgi:hypothetical protein
MKLADTLSTIALRRRELQVFVNPEGSPNTAVSEHVKLITFIKCLKLIIG